MYFDIKAWSSRGNRCCVALLRHSQWCGSSFDLAFARCYRIDRRGVLGRRQRLEIATPSSIWRAVVPNFGKSPDDGDWFLYVLWRVTLMLKILKVAASTDTDISVALTGSIIDTGH